MAKKTLPKLSSAETQIISILYLLGSSSVQQIFDNLPADRDIAYATVQTLLRRLEKKGYIKHSIKGKAHIFSPTAPKENLIKKSVGDFIAQLFGGDAIPLVQHLAKNGQITEQDIDKLKDIIKKSEAL
ncbi:MAG: BlaI/MecI/CopY family transcriptional regulator [Phycisphaerae bacterium]|jgi:predicted transcriptional regulator